MKTNPFGIQYISMPTEYYTGLKTNYQNQNGWGGYGSYGSLTVDGNENFINSDSHPGRTLDFNFIIKGTGKYKIELYVDKDHDCLFDENPRVLSSSYDGGVAFTDSVECDSVLDKDFVGGFAWKLVITETGSGGKSISHVGYSAVRNTSTKKQTINLLQIYPTDYKAKYAGTESPQMISNPVLLIPTKDEIEAAEKPYNATSNPGGKGHKLTEYMINESGTGLGIMGLVDHFNGVLSVDIMGHDTRNITSDALLESFITSNTDPVPVHSETVKLPDNGPNGNEKRSKLLLYNSALLSYFIAKLEDYDINATRFSVYEFNKAVKNDEIQINEKTKLLAKATQVKNADGSLRYGYTATELGLNADWASQEIDWNTGNKEKVYLVSEDTGKIYGYRYTQTDSEDNVEYKQYFYPDKFGSIKGEKICELTDFDLLMLGFGSTMDYMSSDATQLIYDYIDGDGPSFIGNGTVTLNDNNSLGRKIKSLIGMSDVRTGETDFVSNGRGTSVMMTTNDTLFLHYPYTVNFYMRSSICPKQPYKLNLTGADSDPIVSYSKYVSETAGRDYGSNYGYGNWGDGQENYYLYKKGNVTFCGFGSWNGNATETEQRASVMTMAENIMIVNAMVTTARSASDPESDPAWMNCEDIDASIIEKELDDDLKDSSGKKIYNFADAVYTDFDSFGMVKYFKSDSMYIEGHSDSAVVSLNNQVKTVKYATGQPAGYTDENEVRWIAYHIKTPSDNTVLKITTEDGQPLALDMYTVAISGDNVTATKMSPESNGVYKITNKKGFYYICVPLKSDNSAYESYPTKKLGFNFDNVTASNNIDRFNILLNLQSGGQTVEYHTINMIRRVLYPVK